jgi:hypothetical protein
MNASYDILQSILGKPPVIEVAPKRTRKQTSRDDKLVLEVIKKISHDDLMKMMEKFTKQ